MVDLSHEDLKNILQNRIRELENLNYKEEKKISLDALQSFLKIMALPSDFLPLVKRVLELSPRKKLVWLHLAECTGCSEGLLKAENPTFEELVFNYYSIAYHETIMNASGFEAEESVEEILSHDNFILVVEGGVAAVDTYFFTIGAFGESGYDLLQRSAKKADMIFAIGTCSCYGGIQAAYPNPSKVCGIGEVLTQKVVNIPGCPPSGVNIAVNLAFYAVFGIAPNLDEKDRPKWAYSKCLHDLCERKAKFESGIFAEKFDDGLAKNGACLFKIGCKGPYAYNNCPKVKFNLKTSWPVAAGHGCIACSEPDFWDNFGCYELPMNNAFAYVDFSFKEKIQKPFLQNLNLENKTLMRNYNAQNITLNLNENTQILYYKDNAILNFLNFEFESNLKLVLQKLTKNKLGQNLLQNYQNNFPKHYAFIQSHFDEIPKSSSNLKILFENIYILAKGEFLKDTREFLDYAANYKFPHISPFGMKFSIDENNAKLDMSKSFRMPLIYLCGGLEIEALAFSLVSSLIKNFSEALCFLSDRERKQIVLNCEDSFNTDFLQSCFKQYCKIPKH